MHLKSQEVNKAFKTMVHGIQTGSIQTIRMPSRNGDVLVIPEPVTITYGCPQQKVLFNQQRDCNPFFHVFESLWMLAGREDVDPLSYFNSNIKNYSDDGRIFNGAYGNRWRNWRVPSKSDPSVWISVDQLSEVAERFKKNPNDRRCVVEMWSVHSDLMRPESLDNCCNTHIYFLVQNGCLNMTVCNRSNDMVWGTFGANVVHMSFLLEYMARKSEYAVGVYNQITNNLHVYTEKWTPQKWLSDNTPSVYDHANRFVLLSFDPNQFDEECKEFIDEKEDGVYKEPFLNCVASPMCLAFRHHKERDYSKAFEAASRIKSDDWRIASINWLEKRMNNWEKKHAETTSEDNS